MQARCAHQRTRRRGGLLQLAGNVSGVGAVALQARDQGPQEDLVEAQLAG